MVYDASEGSGDPQTPGGAAYVVNEWIDGETLAERLTRGPLPDREVRTVLRRLAEGVAEAHRVGLAVGGLTPENVVLRPNGLVGLRAVPAATGTIDGDIAALGALLEACMTGLGDTGQGTRPVTGSPDLLALVRRARSTEPGQGLSSVAAMAALLAERPRTGPGAGGPPHRTTDESDSGWLRRLRERRPENDGAAAGAAAPVRLNPDTLPPVPQVRPVTNSDTALSSAALGGDTIDAGFVAPSGGAYAGTPAAFPDTATGNSWSSDDAPFGVLDDDGYGYDDPPTGETGTDEDGAGRHRLLVFGLPLVALVVVIALAWWIGSTLLDVTDNVDDVEGSSPSISAPADGSADPSAPVAGDTVTVAGADVFDPGGDGEPENDQDVPLALDDDAATAWSTLEYRGSPAFGNLKDGVGLLLDLGDAQALAGVTLTTTTPGATVEIRTGDEAGAALDDFDLAADGTLTQSTDLGFDEQVTARYVLVWITGLVPSTDGFAADISGITVQSAG
jgi:hypothetical protein